MKKQIPESVDERIEEIESNVLDLMDISIDACNGEMESVLDFNKKYISIVQQIENVTTVLLRHDKTRHDSRFDKIDSLNDDLNYIYDSASIQINSIIAAKTLELEESYRKSQGLQLAVFSIVLSILAFVLTNAKILAANEISFKNVLLVNLSFILSTDILFSMIYLFLGPLFYSKKGRLRFFTFIILPILLIASIVLVSIFMK